MEKEKYKEAAQLERLLLTRFSVEQKVDILELTPIDGYEAYDAIMADTTTAYLIEAKVREYSAFNWSTWKIQKDKWDKLIDMYNASEGTLTPLYVNFHEDGTRVFNLLDYQQDITWKKEWLPKSKFDKTLVEKEIGELNIDKAKFYPSKIDIIGEKIKIKQQNQKIKTQELKDWVINNSSKYGNI